MILVKYEYVLFCVFDIMAYNPVYLLHVFFFLFSLFNSTYNKVVNMHTFSTQQRQQQQQLPNARINLPHLRAIT